MYDTGVVALVAELVDADPAACDRAGLAELVAMSQKVRSWFDAFDARLAVHALVSPIKVRANRPRVC